MKSHFLVVPPDKDLISKLDSQSLVPVIDSTEDIVLATEMVDHYNAHLHCLIICTRIPLTALDYKEEWRNIPIALFTPSMGRFSKMVKHLPVLRQLNIRIYLPTATKENYADIRILSSLGIETAVVFQKDGLAWDLLIDLMSYAYFARATHAPIAPFDYMAARFHSHQRNDYSAVYFDDPRTYLHLNRDGRIALTRADLLAGRFITQDLDELETIEQNEAYQNYLEAWRAFFLQPDGCAYCPGWRVCLGKYSHTNNRENGCQKFISEFLDALEMKQSLQEKNTINIWQP